MSTQPNPYEVLIVPRNASITVVEEAYDRLFDEYEAQAHAGDRDAIEMLNALNAARDTLIDPRRRAALEASLAPTTETPGNASLQPSSSSTKTTPKPTTTQTTTTARSRTNTLTRPQSKIQNPKSKIQNARPRSRVIAARPQRSLVSLLPFLVIIVFLAFALALAITYLLTKGSGVPVEASRGNVVATVNGQPIYSSDYDERVAIDQQTAANDPLLGTIFSANTITGTRAIDILKQDSLDKLINMEVIQQQAKKETLYPTNQAEIDNLINQAKQSDLKGGQSFEDFLKKHNISEAKYNRVVLQNIVYTVMADHHLPTQGTVQDRTNAFIQWVCDTRKQYDVKILIAFIVAGNPPCSSGLPSDIPLPNIDQQAPTPDATAPAKLTPGAKPTTKAP